MRAAIVLVAAILLTAVPARADGISIRDLIELSRAGLSDEVLLALLEVDRPVLPIDADTLKSLKEAGVSERVILAVVRSGRARPESAPQEAVVQQQAPEPQVIVIDHHDPAPAPAPVQVAVPVYYPVYSWPVATAKTKPAQQPQEPVYWGWGGKLRPDAWQPTPPPPQEKGELIKIAPPLKMEPPYIRRQQ